MPAHHEAWRGAFRAAGASFDFDWDLFISRAGMGLKQTVVELNAQFGESMDPAWVVAEQRRLFRQLESALRPIQSVVEVAEAQRGKLPMCVASGGEKPVVLGALERLKIRGWFDHVVCTIDVAQGKPAPDLFLHCAELMGVAPETCLVFEDGTMGFEAAERAGMGWVAADGTGRNSETHGLGLKPSAQ